MPFNYFSGSKIKFVPVGKIYEQSDNPFAPGYVPPKNNDYYPPIFYKIRPKIIQKYGGICFLCGKPADEVHHIDYDKMNCVESNFALLCKSCHARTNVDREYWKSFFQSRIDPYEIDIDKEEE